MTEKKPRTIKLAAVGYRKGQSVTILHASDDAYFNWLSRMSDDNPELRQADNVY